MSRDSDLQNQTSEMGSTEQARPVACGRIIGLFALILIPLVGHGCHGDDADHEPGIIPLLQRPTVADSPAPAWPPAPHPR